MATTETFVTRYLLDDQYSAKASKIAASTRGAASATGDLAHKIGYTLGSALRNAAIGLAGTAVGLGFMGVKAMQAAAAFDSMERAFGGSLGSMERGRQMMAFIEDYALRSAFGLEEMTQAALSLQLAGLSVGRFLPIVEALALATGNVSAEGLLDVASVLRRLQGGQIAEALGPEGLGRFGVNRQALQAYGAKFGKGGQFQGSTEQAFAIVERLVNEKLRPIADAVGSGDQAKLSNASDAMAKAFREIGGVLNEQFLPAITQGAEMLVFLVKEGVVRDLADQFVGLLGVSGEDGLAGALALATASAEKFGMFLSRMQDFWFGGGKPAWLEGLIDTIFPRKLLDAASKMLGGTGDLGKDFSNVFFDGESVGDRASELMGRFRARKKSASLTAPEGGLGASSALETIATATVKTAENTAKSLSIDMRRFALGGGELGRIGLTAVELERMRRSGPVSVSLAGVFGSRALQQAMQEIVMDVLTQLRRQGALAY